MKARRHRYEWAGMEQLAQWIVIIGTIAAFGIFYVWLQIQNRNAVRDVMRLESRMQWLTRETARLDAEVTRMTSRDTVQPLAVEVLHLEVPAVGQAITIAPRETPEVGRPIADAGVSGASSGDTR